MQCVRVCVCTGKREKRGEREHVCVWKKEAVPVNGELTGFLPLETTNSAVLLFMRTPIIDSDAAKGNMSSFEGGARRRCRAFAR